MALAASALVAILVLLAVWPPGWAPESWRRVTRRLRHRVRRRYYRHAGPWGQVHPPDNPDAGYDWDGDTTPKG